MALFPDAIHKLIPPGSSDPKIDACGVVLHVADSLGDSLFDWFNGPSGGIESHFYIRRSGVIEQYRDTGWEADANYHGNSFYRDGRLRGLLSIETEGLADGEWTPEQLASIKRLLLWMSRTHGFPLRQIEAWNGTGVGWHIMFGTPGPWTPSRKSCPGPLRIKQFLAVLVPWMKAGAQDPTEPWPQLHTHSPAAALAKRKLSVAGYFRGLMNDYYDARLRIAVHNFQLSRDDLKGDPDGLFGPATWDAVVALPDAPPPPPKGHGDIDGVQDAAQLLKAASDKHPGMPKLKALATAVHRWVVGA